MRLLSQLVAALLVFLLTPGLAEMVDDAVHLVRTGHTEHSATHAGSHGTDAEHGCTGTFHTCSCHQTPSFLEPPAAPALAEGGTATRPVAWRHAGPAEGVRAELSRPPAG